MTHHDYLIRENNGKFEAVHRDDGWNCDWEWIYSYNTLESLIARLDEEMSKSYE